MKKTVAAIVAVATIAGSLAATPASAQRGVAAGVVGGLIGGAIIGGAIASSRPAYAAPAPVYVDGVWLRHAEWCGSGSGTDMTGVSVASRCAADPIVPT